MSNGTLLTQFELLSGLADNNAKLITATDVSNIVKSNFQPVIVWSGVFIRDTSTNGGSFWYPRTNYYNPDFFEPRGTGAGIDDAQQVWEFTNRGSLSPNTTYTNIEILPDAFLGTQQLFANQYITRPATFNLYTDGNGAVDSYDIVSCGQGWVGPAGYFTGTPSNGTWSNPGQTGSSNIAGVSQNVEVRFNGPITPLYTSFSSPAWKMSKNTNSPTASVPGQGSSINADHTFINTIVQHSQTRFKNNNTGTPGWWVGPTAVQSSYNSQVDYSNQLSSHGIESAGNEVENTVTLWRMPF
tara:strand:- start:63 stop:956 length:894 start_codon:yes stop_codon:yes gene_type:complete